MSPVLSTRLRSLNEAQADLCALDVEAADRLLAIAERLRAAAASTRWHTHEAKTAMAGFSDALSIPVDCIKDARCTAVDAADDQGVEIGSAA